MNHRRELAVFLAAAAFTYLTIHRDITEPNHGNQWSRLALTFAIVERGSFAIDEYVAGHTEDWSRRGEHVYSNKAPGPALLAVPFYKLQHDIQSKFDVAPDDPRARNLAVYVANLVSTVAPTLLALLLMFVALRRGFDATPLQAFGVCAAWGIGSLALVYSTLFFGHQSAAAFFAIGMFLSLLEAEPAEAKRRPLYIFLAGLAMGLAVAADYIAAQVVLVWTVWLAWRVRFDKKVLGAWVLGGLGPALVLLSYNKICFGGFFTTAYAEELINPRWRPLNTIDAPSLSRLADITVRPFRGIFYCTPVWALMLVAIDQRLQRGRAVMLAAAIAVVGQFFYLTMLPSAFGGFCIGPRYATALLPLAAVLLLPSLRLLPRLFAALLALSALLMLTACLTEPVVHESFKDPFHDWLFPVLERGGPTSQRNLFTWLFDFSLAQALAAYLTLFAAVAVWLWRRLRHSPEKA